MKPYPKIRKTAKWLSVVASALLIFIWVASIWWTLNWASPGGLYIGIDSGRIWCSVYGSLSQAEPPTLWFFYQHPPRFFLWFATEQRGAWNYVWVPLWVLFAPVLFVTVVLWKRDASARRLARVGFCSKCGYDLSASPPEAPCPECGRLRSQIPSRAN